MGNCSECKKDALADINSSLKCATCGNYVHLACLTPKPMSHLKGDNFFRYTCLRCHDDGDVTMERLPLPWLTIVHLAVYNMSIDGAGQKGFFRFRDICTFIDQSWYILSPDKTRTPNWRGTTAGVLSTHSPRIFKSGQRDCDMPGWWSLVEICPPLLRNDQKKGNNKGISKAKRKREHENQEIQPMPLNGIHSDDLEAAERVTPGEGPHPTKIKKEQGGIDDDRHGNVRGRNDTANEDDPRGEYFQLHSALDDIFSADLRDLEKIDGEGSLDGIASHSVWNSDEPSSAVILCKTEPCGSDVDKQKPSETTNPPSHLRDGSPSDRPRPTVVVASGDGKANAKLKSSRSGQNSKGGPIKMRFLSEAEEHNAMKSLDTTTVDNARSRRLYRKLKLRSFKRSVGLPLFDVDAVVRASINRVLPPNATLSCNVTVVEGTEFATKSQPTSDMHTRHGFTHPALRGVNVLDRFKTMQVSRHGQDSRRHCSFLSKLRGSDADLFTRMIASPYTSRVLKPYVRRDNETTPLRVKLLTEISLAASQRQPDIEYPPYVRATIDYCYVQPLHIPIVNAMCGEFFWPGIDLSECLQYPDFSCVVMYKRLVIGCGFMVPDVKYNEAYVSFLLVHPDWQRCGIGTFLLYHLIQTCMGKDVTLHVSADSPSMLFYQKFGFKAEGLMLDFYDQYLPAASRDSRHAFFMRLQR